MATAAPTAPPAARRIPWSELSRTETVCGAPGACGLVRVWRWRAQGINVAIKELHPARVGLTAAQEAALVTECDLQASLDAHPGVARVHGLAEDAAAHHYGLVMRHYDHALSAELEGGAAAAPIALSLERVLRIARGLAHLHAHGVIHGDVKPANILVVEARGGAEVALTDFGLSQAKHAAHMSTSEGRKGAGTPSFMAPELFEEDEDGVPLHGVSTRADVFALGVTAWCVLTGHATPYPATDGGGRPIFPARRVKHGLRPVSEGLRPESEGLGAALAGLPAHAAEEVVATLRACWSTSPGERPTIDDVVARLGAAAAALPRAKAGQLIEAACANDVARVLELLAQGADVHEKNSEGYGALAHAAYRGCTAAITVLLKHGANIRDEGQNKMTPLHCAINNGQVATVKELLAWGAPLDVTNCAGCTPLAWAVQRGNDEITALVRAHAAGAAGPPPPPCASASP